MTGDWHISSETSADGAINIRLFRFSVEPGSGADIHDRADYTISHEDAWHLFTNLAGQLRGQSDERMRNAAAGDCATCGNLRLIDVPSTRGLRDGVERIHCPDCHERYANAKPAYPSWLQPIHRSCEELGL